MAKVIHKEDIKAALRKQFGTINAFQEANGLRGQAVRDLLRGQSSTAKEAVARVMGVDPDHFVITSSRFPLCGAHSNRRRRSHRLNGGAK